VLDTSMMGLKPDTACEGGYDGPRPSRRLAIRTPGVGVEVYGKGWTSGGDSSRGGLFPSVSLEHEGRGDGSLPVKRL